ncbi:hypothetical protein [Bradyrhizobium sp. CB2312]|uniref:hypothetical protein n=1 Tax=Bradyrhizobium sp. CB2312 TaxID=3039155 RepID=UPI0024B08F36|nr:hypothetical protein [Bradyrhizobium sp. CB2312]WFU74907.1 hypothetical protein QA642_13090 [Bradyrhizobium sp. CB2312]
MLLFPQPTLVIAAGHIARSPSLIDEDEALGNQAGLVVKPLLASLYDVRSVRSLGLRGLFLHRALPGQEATDALGKTEPTSVGWTSKSSN